MQQVSVVSWVFPPSPAPWTHGLLSFLVPSLVVAPDIVVAAQNTISRFQFAPDEGEETGGKMAPSVVDMTHDYVSATCKR